MLVRLEVLPHQENVDLAHTDEHVKFSNPSAVALLCVLKACWPLTLRVVHVDGFKVPPADRVDCPLL
jgi:hypothetical protein